MLHIEIIVFQNICTKFYTCRMNKNFSEVLLMSVENTYTDLIVYISS